jgi:hypothetical protein
VSGSGFFAKLVYGASIMSNDAVILIVWLSIPSGISEGIEILRPPCAEELLASKIVVDDE